MVYSIISVGNKLFINSLQCAMLLIISRLMTSMVVVLFCSWTTMLLNILQRHFTTARIRCKKQEENRAILPFVTDKQVYLKNT